MRAFDYTPEDGRFKGKIKINIPNFQERIALCKEVGQGLKDDADQLDSVTKIYQLVSKHLISIDIKVGKQPFKSLDDLEYYEEGSVLINELGSLVLKGIGLGKS